MPNAIKMIQTTKLLFFSALFSAEDGDVGGAIDRTRHRPEVHALGGPGGDPHRVPHFRGRYQYPLQVHRGGLSRPGLGGRTISLRLMSVQDPEPVAGAAGGGFPRRKGRFSSRRGPISSRRASATSAPFTRARTFGRSSVSGSSGRSLRRICAKHWRRSIGSRPRPLLPYYQSRAESEGLGPAEASLVRVPVQGLRSVDSEAAFMKVAQIEAIMLANRTGLACRLYKSRTGSYPVSLEELVPGILNEVPVDPVHGEALRLSARRRGLHRLQPRIEPEGRRRTVDLHDHPAGHGQGRRLDLEGRKMTESRISGRGPS